MKSNIKVIEFKSNKPGKNVVILVGVHGNEICGVQASDKIASRLNIDSGKVTFIYSNLEAIKQNKRFIEKNLNRCFFREQNKEIKNSLEGRTALEIMSYLDKADIMLDIHASATKNSQPFVICRESLMSEANIFDVKLVVFNFDEFEPGSTEYYMNQLSKKGFGIECGYMDDSKSIEFAEKAIIAFLISNKCIKGSLNLKKNQRFLKII
ncbi:MAG: succinylglutamate desuccinylase/aspartoacylase family protein, partial [Nanoarchaeota archaeon]